jgi:hypothetical protein
MANGSKAGISKYLSLSFVVKRGRISKLYYVTRKQFTKLANYCKLLPKLLPLFNQIALIDSYKTNSFLKFKTLQSLPKRLRGSLLRPKKYISKFTLCDLLNQVPFFAFSVGRYKA